MSLFRTIFSLAAALSLAAPGLAVVPGPKPADVLVWSQAERQDRFFRMESLFPHRTVKAGATPRPLNQGPPLALALPGGLDAYMAADRTAGLMILHDGRIRLERYGPTLSPGRHWAGFSVTKSITSTLYAIALRDGRLRSLDDSVATYLPEMKGSAYQDVTLRQLLTMSSGVKWNEDYGDPTSDVARMYATPADPGFDPIVSFMRKLPREAPAGSKWAYKTGETDLAGVLLVRATGKSLADYATEKLWRPLGMAYDAVWMIDEQGFSPGGCCLSATLGDYARFGQFILDGGKVEGRALLPADWLAQATTSRIATGYPGIGYGYFWWTNADGSFDARGIFGQQIHIDRKRRLVVVALAAWDAPIDPKRGVARAGLIKAIETAIDAGR